jgi:hypothetical protein
MVELDRVSGSNHKTILYHVPDSFDLRARLPHRKSHAPTVLDHRQVTAIPTKLRVRDLGTNAVQEAHPQTIVSAMKY